MTINQPQLFINFFDTLVVGMNQILYAGANQHPFGDSGICDYSISTGEPGAALDPVDTVGGATLSCRCEMWRPTPLECNAIISAWEGSIDRTIDVWFGYFSAPADTTEAPTLNAPGREATFLVTRYTVPTNTINGWSFAHHVSNGLPTPATWYNTEVTTGEVNVDTHVSWDGSTLPFQVLSFNDIWTIACTDFVTLAGSSDLAYYSESPHYTVEAFNTAFKVASGGWSASDFGAIRVNMQTFWRWAVRRRDSTTVIMEAITPGQFASLLATYPSQSYTYQEA